MDHALHNSAGPIAEHSNLNPTVSTEASSATTNVSMIEREKVEEYRRRQSPSFPSPKSILHVHNPSDGSVLLDHNGKPVSVDKILATKPLRGELSTRRGPGNKQLTYISGDGVTRTLNDIFGYDGWNLDITNVQKEDSIRDDKTGKFTVVYTARVRVTHRASGSYREDCGAGDSTDRCFATAISHALKASVTDAMKRAARHFGDKLGNSLYQGAFTINKAPLTLKDALDKCDIERANTKFGFKPAVTPMSTDRNPEPVVSESTSSTTNVHIGTPVPQEKVVPPPAQVLPASSNVSLKARSMSLASHPAVPSNAAPQVANNPAPYHDHQLHVTRGVLHSRNNDARNMQVIPVASPAFQPQAPPTPLESLRNCTLFAPENCEFVQTTTPRTKDVLVRPQSSYGRPASTNCDANDRRTSVGSGNPIQSAPHVTPIQKQTDLKRATSVQPTEAPAAKRTAINPYGRQN
eukprot:Nitzschia sp. Nitz4//scaffold3_size479765//143813//145277//NITZ4_000062-RA/size479765-processed-gene-0.70-mRNA-1//1//CDS//3329550644//9162//frame0